MKTVNSGFTLFETVLAMAIISVISVASIYMLYLSLSLRDLSLSSSKAEEAIRIFSRDFRQAAINAKTISGGGLSLFLTSSDTCWSFIYDSVQKNVKYSKIKQTGCVPNQNPSLNFFPVTVKVNSINFYFSSLDTGGRQVGVSGNISSVLPFDKYQTSFDSSYVNLID